MTIRFILRRPILSSTLVMVGALVAGCAHSEPAPALDQTYAYSGTRDLGPTRVTNVTTEDGDSVNEMIQVDPGVPSPLPMRLSTLENVCGSLSIHFATDSAEIDARAERQLERLAECLRREQIRAIVVTGHADARGTRPYNYRLGLQRAHAVAEFLRDRGADPTDRIRVESRGEDAARWQLYWSDDRRVDVVAEAAEDHD